ncbi:MAG TPA: ribosome recycling factor [Candidatus Saccharimonadia bacterium]|nr:ribosome recycling factor [Candidatus Saccharimonadia bacterium]
MVRPLVDSAGPKMEKAIDHFEEDLKSLRTGRASVAILDSVIVEYYGSVQPLKAIASVNTPDARSLAITPWDNGALASIEKAIRENQALGLNPSNDGNVIRISIPPMTEERRRDVVKSMGAKVEDCRVRLRNIRHDVLNEVKRMEKAKEATVDDVKFAEAELNKKIDLFQKRIDELEAAKSKEIMEV